MPMTRDDIFAKVSDRLQDALGVDEDEVTPEATLTGDLGAESIDFLDIVFRLEKAFGIKIPRGELFPESLTAADSNFVQDGVVTDDGLAELRTKMPPRGHRLLRRRPEGRKHPGTVHGKHDRELPRRPCERLRRRPPRRF